MSRVPTAPLAELNGKPPPEGEVTRKQDRWPWGRAGGVGMQLLSGSPCPGGTYNTYRLIASNPTVALAEAAGTAPVKAIGCPIEADDDAPDGAVELIQDVLWPIWADVINETLRAMRYGWQSAELIWAERGGAWVVDRFKPLLPELTDILVDEHGTPTGVKNQGVILGPGKAYLASFEGEASDPYGRSIYENIRESAFWPWTNTLKQLSSYGIKGASIIPVLQYPVGLAGDATGAEQETWKLAAQVLANAGKGDGVMLPVVLHDWAQALIQAGANPTEIAKLMAWQLTFLEARSGHGTEYLSQLKHHESNMARGLFTPERAIMEGTFGTKAEAESHFDLRLLISEQWMAWAFQTINRGIVNHVLAVNYGPDVAGKVYLVSKKLADADAELMRGVFKAQMESPANVDLLLTWTDVNSWLDGLHWPKAKEVIEAEPRMVDEEETDDDPPIKSALAELARRRRGRRYVAA